METLKARVEKLLITQPFGTSPIKVEKIEVLLDGIKYDKHFGKTRNADVKYARLLPKGIEVVNLRAITLVSVEELKEISNDVGVEILPSDLEANITLSGVKNLTKFVPGTFMRFPRNAILFITAENLPCVVPSLNMMKRGIEKLTASKFAKAAMGKRGLTAIPFASGFVKVGDEVEIIPPQNLE
ncbi:hypothetical protein HYW61_00580 [candidate division WWE3 bacterium]|nr:hypothetical protein [candidate division WWE3 bacterium]